MISYPTRDLALIHTAGATTISRKLRRRYYETRFACTCSARNPIGDIALP